MENDLELLKRLIADAPELESKYKRAHVALLEEINSNSGKQENGFVYHVRPSVQQSDDYWLGRYNENGQAILELSAKLNLTVFFKR